MTLQVRLSLKWVVGTLVLFMALLFLIDMYTQYHEWNHRKQLTGTGDLQRGYCEVDFPGSDLCPRDKNSLSLTFEKIRERFDIDREGTIPTWYSAFLESVCGLTLIALGFRSRQSGGRMFVPWVVIGAIFFYLSIDDTVTIHELLGGDNSIGGSLKEKLGIGLAFVWVIPAMIVLVALLPFFIPFFLKLPQRTFGLFFIAGVLFIFTQVVMESYAGNHLTFNTMKYHWESALEDGPGKQGALIVFLFGLLTYARDYLQEPVKASKIVADLPLIRELLRLPVLRVLRPEMQPSGTR